MSSSNTPLYEIIDIGKDVAIGMNPGIVDISTSITDNLQHNFFDWQKEAFENLLYYNISASKLKNLSGPNHVMFNMATGSGKTLLMAACILYYYQQNYKHFLFFVNRNNIVSKTEDNFINTNHKKCLFKETIMIDDKPVPINKVNQFSDNPAGIEIKFTSIQKLYNDIHIEKENQTTLEELNQRKIVMLADEAHHLNADTQSKKDEQQELDYKKLTRRSSSKDVERKGWEHTVIELILNKNGNKNNITNTNVLLEFTATVPDNKQVERKYLDKIIYKFDLKDFLAKGYTKQINLLSSSLGKKERILHALIFNWYRHQLALDYGIPNFKPVVLFRSKLIKDSRNDYEYFLDLMDNLKATDFNFLNKIYKRLQSHEQLELYEMGKSRTEDVIKFIKENRISFSTIVSFIRYNFREKNVIITNSKDGSAKKEKTSKEINRQLNNLEDKDNHIRAIFTVERLTEGWDVLNLFDIVRLYEGQNAGGSTTKTPEATTKEKQLIGRGVRYFPFKYKDIPCNKRKFDNDVGNKLRPLEELYYYTYDEKSWYISHLKKELDRDGYIDLKTKAVKFALKPEFIQTDFYKKAKVWKNELQKNLTPVEEQLKSINFGNYKPYKIHEITFSEVGINSAESDGNLKQNKSMPTGIKEKGHYEEDIPLKKIDRHILSKAINVKAKSEGSIFRFDKLKDKLEVTSVTELTKEELLGNNEVKYLIPNGSKYDDIDARNKLDGVLNFLTYVEKELTNKIVHKIGGDFEAHNFSEIFGKEKIKTIKEDKVEDKPNVVREKWYLLNEFYGTSEEENLIEFIRRYISILQRDYEEVYLLRNEEVYKIYDFDSDKGFQPDFILFLKNFNNDGLGYQVLIEPKGNLMKDNEGKFKNGKEGWKEDFLLEISEKYGENIITHANSHYRLIGLPFFNNDLLTQDDPKGFKAQFKKFLNL